MKTTIVLFGFFLALAQCHVSRLEKAGHHHLKKRQVNSGGNKVLVKPVSTPGQKHDCKPTGVCVANGGYCIQSKKEEDCNGLFFPKECKSALCSCCVENKCDSNPCGPNFHCVSTPGSYECVCNSGYEIVNGNCVDINECAASNNTCPIDEKCNNTQGSYTCEKICPADMTYIPLQVACAKRLSGNMDAFEGISLCTGSSMVMARVLTDELINYYGDAFLTNVGDSAWVYAAADYILQTPTCPILTKTANSTIAGELGYYNKLPYVLCYTPVPP